MTKRRPGRARLAASERPRDRQGRWLSNRTIAALKGVQTRLAKQKAKTPGRQVREARDLREAFRHGQAARERTERRLTPADKAARTKRAKHIARSDAARKGWETRRAKKVPRPRQRPAPGSQKTRTKRTTGQAPTTLSSRSPTSTATRDSAISTGKTSTSKLPRIQFHSRKGKADALKVQINVRAKLPAGTIPSRRLLNEAIVYRLDHGVDHPNFETRIIQWQNPGRKARELRQWRQGNQPDAWLTLGGAIRAAALADL